MAGPIVEAAREMFSTENKTVLDKFQERDIELEMEQRERLQEMMDSGGCCNAAMAAEASRQEGTEYR